MAPALLHEVPAGHELMRWRVLHELPFAQQRVSLAAEEVLCTVSDGAPGRPQAWFFPLPPAFCDVIYDVVITGDLVSAAFSSAFFRDAFFQREPGETGRMSVRYRRSVSLVRLAFLIGKFEVSVGVSGEAPTVTCVAVDLGREARRADCRPVVSGNPFHSDVWDHQAQAVRQHELDYEPSVDGGAYSGLRTGRARQRCG